MPASAVYKVQARVAGSYRGGQPHVRVGGHYYNPKAVYVKVNGKWRMAYQYFVWYYNWVTGPWGSCTCIGWCSSRTVTCYYYPESIPVSASYCGNLSKPADKQICNCHCACKCCCC